MATPGMGTFGITGSNAVDASTKGYYWILGPDRTVDWAIAGCFASEYWGDPSALASGIGQMLTNISTYANIRFNYVGSFVNPSHAYAAGSEITVSLSAYLFSGPTTWARGYFPTPIYNTYPGEPGDIYLNLLSPANSLPSYAPGSSGYALFMHEILHTLGLKHPHDDTNGRPTLQDLKVPQLDTDWFTVMSYDDSFPWNTIGWEPATPMALDVLALQFLYGPNMSTNAGTSTFALERINAYGTIWDASGTNLVTVAGQWEGWLIALPNVTPSTLVPTKIGFAAPTSDVNLPSPTTLFWLMGDMENATGSAYGDVLLGSDAGNRLTGGGGNDLIDGGAGIDTAVFTGTPGQYVFQRNADTVTLSGPDGFDTLANVERLQIGSVKFAIDIDGHGGQAYRLYQAAFNRAPDPGGLGYQMNALDIGLSLSQVAGNFIASPEFQRTYGALNNTQFVTQLYANVLHRAPDAGGLAYHVTHLSQGFARADILVGFSESPENQAALIGVISNGMFYT